MIATSFNKWKAIAITLAVILATLLTGGGVLYFRVTAKVDPKEYGDTNPLDAREANRKLNLFHAALQAGPAGYIRLSRAEVNSLLEQQLESPSTDTPASASKVVRCRVDFTPTSVSLCCWIRQSLFGRETTVVWERTGALSRDGNRWVFQPTEMKLGSQVVPEKLWHKVEDFLGGEGTGFMERCEWLAKAPAVRVTQNKITRQTELQLYTYLETNFLTQVRR